MASPVLTHGHDLMKRFDTSSSGQCSVMLGKCVGF